MGNSAIPPTFHVSSHAYRDWHLQSIDADLFRFWFNLMCMSVANDLHGRIPATDDIAKALKMTPVQVDEYIEALEDNDLIAPFINLDESTEPFDALTHWKEWQDQGTFYD